MVKAITLSIDDILENNPTICLSVHRAFKECFKCEKYKRAEKLGKLSRIKCNPLNDENRLRRINSLKAKKVNLETDLKAVNKELEDN